MKKSQEKKYAITNSEITTVAEPVMAFMTSVPLFSKHLDGPNVKNTQAFTYKHFKKIAAKVDFTIQDWASLLCISERTLQRYAKTNGEFNGLQIERILLLEKMIDNGKILFGNNLGTWLRNPSFKYNGEAPFAMLFTYNGIVDVIQYIGQLEWGVLP